MILSRRGVALALTASLLCAGVPVSARKKQPAPPPAPSGGLVDNVNGLAIDGQGRLVRFSGLIIDEEGKVEQRLQPGEPRPSYPRYRLDGKGRTLIPSLVDGHISLMEFGLARLTLDLSGTTSLAQAQQAIAAYVAASPGRKWILGRGWDNARWGSATAPSAADLDAATGDTPAFLLSADGQRGWVNSAALRAAGLARVVGPLSASQTAQVQRVAPQPSAKDRDMALEKAQQFLLAAGVGTVADIGTSIEDWQSYRRAGDRGALRLRIAGYGRGIEQTLLIAGPEPTPWLYGGRLKLAGAAFRLDNASPTPAAPRMDGTALRNQMSRAAMDGFQLVTTVQGGAARDEALAAYAEMALTYTGDRRWRLELPQGGAVAATDGVIVTSPIADQGAAGSFAPFLSPSPFAAMARVAASRSIAPALAAFTRLPSTAAQAERITGTLEPGSSADFLLIDRDISTIAPADIAGAQVLEHWLGGRRVVLNAPQGQPAR